MYKLFSKKKFKPLPNESTNFYEKVRDSKPTTIKEWEDNLFSALETAIKNKDLKQLEKLLGLSHAKLVDEENKEKSKKTIRFLNYIRNLDKTQTLLLLAIKENGESIANLLMQQEEFKQVLTSNDSQALRFALEEKRWSIATRLLKEPRQQTYIQDYKHRILVALVFSENTKALSFLIKQPCFELERVLLLNKIEEPFLDGIKLYIFSNSLHVEEENIINELSQEPKMLVSLIFDNDNMNHLRSYIFNEMKPRILAYVAGLKKKQNLPNLEETLSEDEALFCKMAKCLFEQYSDTGNKDDVTYLLKCYENHLNLKKLKENIAEHIGKKTGEVFKLTDKELDLCIKLSLKLPKNSPNHRYVISLLATCTPPNEFIEVRHALSEGQELGSLDGEDNHTVTFRTSASL